MVVLNKIYTKTGDAGETALVNGARVAKHSTRVESYGTVDECNATVGMARLHAEGEMDARLELIQNDLFDLGADLCRPDMERDAESEYPPLRVAATQVKPVPRIVEGGGLVLRRADRHAILEGGGAADGAKGCAGIGTPAAAGQLLSGCGMVTSTATMTTMTMPVKRRRGRRRRWQWRR